MCVSNDILHSGDGDNNLIRFPKWLFDLVLYSMLGKTISLPCVK